MEMTRSLITNLSAAFVFRPVLIYCNPKAMNNERKQELNMNALLTCEKLPDEPIESIARKQTHQIAE